MITRVLLGLIALGALAYVGIRLLPTAGGPPNTQVIEEGASLGEAGARDQNAQVSGSRFQDLMRGASGTGDGENLSAGGLRNFVGRLDPDKLSFNELEELFETLADDPAIALSLMDRVLESVDREWGTVEKELLLRRAGRLAALADFTGLDGRLDDLEVFGERALFVQGAAAGLAAQEVEKGLEWVASLGESALQAPALRGVAQSWSQADPTVARQWAEGLEDPIEREQALRGMVAGWAAEDADAAYEYAVASDSDIADGLVVEAATSIVSRDPKRASQWLGATTPNPQQKAVLEKSVADWADDDFEGASTWAKFVSNTEVRDTATASLADHWSRDEPAEATAWVDEFPDTPVKARMLEKTFPRWAIEDPAESAAWFQGRPFDVTQMNLLRKTLKALADEDLSAAEAWLEEINQPGAKQIGESFIRSYQ